MRSASDAMWAIAGRYEVVPAPPDDVLSSMLLRWWAMPRTFACVSARSSSPWCLVLPNPSVWCGECALEAYDREVRCSYCRHVVRKSRALTLLFEMNPDVHVMGRCHEHCQQLASKATRGDR
jgi:hypothetical protein